MGICPLLVGPNLLKDQIITVLPPTELQLPLAAKAISSLKPKLAPPLSFTTRCRQTQQQLLSFTSGFSSAAVTFTMWSHKNLHPMIGIWILLFLLSQAALSSEFHSALQRLQRIVLDASIERSMVGASRLRIICFFCRCRCSKHSLFFPKLYCLLRDIFWQYLDNFLFLCWSLIPILSLLANNVVG